MKNLKLISPSVSLGDRKKNVLMVLVPLSSIWFLDMFTYEYLIQTVSSGRSFTFLWNVVGTFSHLIYSIRSRLYYLLNYFLQCMWNRERKRLSRWIHSIVHGWPILCYAQYRIALVIHTETTGSTSISPFVLCFPVFQKIGDE